MKPLWFFVKTNLKLNLRQAGVFLGVYVAVPVLMSLFMAFSFSSAFVPDDTSNPIDVWVLNEDEGDRGGQLIDILNSVDLQPYLTFVEEKEDADFSIDILPAYSQEMEQTHIEIHSKEYSSLSEERMLVQLLSEIQSTIVNQQILNDAISGMKDQEGVNQLITQLNQANMMKPSQTFVKEGYQSATSLTANQFTSVAGLIYVFMMMFSSSVGMKTKEEFNGLRKRMSMFPLTPTQDVLYSFVTDTITNVFLGVVYIAIWRLIDSDTFTGNLLFYLSWVLIYTMVFIALNNVLYYIIPDKVSGVAYQLFIAIYMIFGLIPFDQILGESAKAILQTNYFRQIFQQPFYDYIIYRDWGQHSLLAVVFVVIVILLTAMIITIRSRKELHPQ